MSTLPNIPPDVWAARPILKDVRDAAHRRAAGADPVLWSFLVSVAAHVPAHVAIETGIGTPIRPSLYAVLAGASGAGKSVAWGVARSLLAGQPEPLPLSTGEGLIESFYGWVWVPQPQASAPTQVARNASLPTGDTPAKPPKLVKARRRIRHNALFWLDEGEQLFKHAERVGSTVHPTLRSFWSGGTVGQANATDELRRTLDAGTYTGGLVIGLQPGVSGKLLSDTATGTAQRFVWTATTDRYLTDGAELAAPAPAAPITWHPPVMPGTPTLEAFRDQPSPDQPWIEPQAPPQVTMTLDPGIAATIRAYQLAVRRGDVEPDEHDTQRTAMHVKVAAVLAWLDGRLGISADDWGIAGALLVTSDQVREALIEHAEMVTAAERVERGVERAQVGRAEANADKLRDRCQAKVTELLCRNGSMTGGELKRGVTPAQRPLLADVLGGLVTDGAVAAESAPSGGHRYRWAEQ